MKLLFFCFFFLLFRVGVDAFPTFYQLRIIPSDSCMTTTGKQQPQETSWISLTQEGGRVESKRRRWASAQLSVRAHTYRYTGKRWSRKKILFISKFVWHADVIIPKKMRFFKYLWIFSLENYVSKGKPWLHKISLVLPKYIGWPW